jgi:predicted dehydrogenase
MEPNTRRQFLAEAARLSVGVAAAMSPLAAGAAEPAAAPGPTTAAGANGVRFVLIGCGGRGRIVAFNMIGMGGRCVGLCDIKDGERKSVRDFLDRYHKTGDLPQHKYPEQVFDRKDVDAVIIATPDHWHAPLAIQACQAGKDVYVEKPHCHNIWESLRMIEAARKYRRVVQVGTQNRSGEYNIKAREYVASGKIGATHLVKVYNLKSGGAFSLGGAGEVPGDLDWDRWLGPAPRRPFAERLFGGGWHHYWDFSGGDLCDDAAHQVDLSLMVMGDPGMPRSVCSVGGRIAHKGDDSQVPDLLITQFEFDNFVLTLEHSNYPKYMTKSNDTIRRGDLFPFWLTNSERIELYGSEQMLMVGRHGGGWQAITFPWRVQSQMFGRVPDEAHCKNFLDCVVSRKRPNSDVETVHPSVCLLHMANISHRVGNKKLLWDGKTCQFDDAGANKLIQREYRKGYEVPEQV